MMQVKALEKKDQANVGKSRWKYITKTGTEISDIGTKQTNQKLKIAKESTK